MFHIPLNKLDGYKTRYLNPLKYYHDKLTADCRTADYRYNADC